jgi:hypothetical protein
VTRRVPVLGLEVAAARRVLQRPHRHGRDLPVRLHEPAGGREPPAGIPPEGFRSPSLGSSLTAQVTQPLFRNFGRSVNRRFIVQNRIARDTSAWQFVRRVQDTVKAVEDAYWDLLYAQANLKSRLEALDRAKDLNRITKIKIDVGASPDRHRADRGHHRPARAGHHLAEAPSATLGTSCAASSTCRTSRLGPPHLPTDQPSFEEQKVDAEGIRRALETASR